TATITTPVAGTLYSAGQTLNFAGSGSDPETGNLPASAFTWRIDFHHDTHTHPALPSTSGITSGSYAIPNRGEVSANVWYRIHLTVKDRAGLTYSTYRDVRPRTATITLATQPAGLQVTLGGQPRTTPISVVGVVGMIRSIGAVSPQTVNGVTYVFSSWSDGGAATHEIVTPATNTTYTAVYRASTADTTPPTVVITAPRPNYSYNDFAPLTQATGTASDTGGSNVAQVRTQLYSYDTATYWNGSTWVATATELPATGTTSWSFTLPALEDGRYALRATARDGAGNLSTPQSVDFWIDNVAPTLVVYYPKPDITYSYSVPDANGAVWDSGPGVAQVRSRLRRASDGFYWNGSGWVASQSELVAQLTFEETQTRWKTFFPPLESGGYTVQAIARDYVGNTALSEVVPFTVSLPSAPSATMASAAASTGGSNNLSTAVAPAATSSVHLDFVPALDSVTATDVEHYVVEINGQIVPVQRASSSASAHRVTLSLLPGTLRVGDKVVVWWTGLSDAQGRPLAAGSWQGKAS
ncbi:MAG: Ig-like domain-containing protein, partial [Armatimonadota bacterium]|nr:Ig-like domain-containing protein [Armatimonadota bacterium]